MYNIYNIKKTNFKNPFKNLKYKNGLFNSIIFLYLIIFVAVVNILMLIRKNDTNSILLFIIISTCVYFSSKKKNLMIALIAPLIIVNFILFIKNRFTTEKLEGMTQNGMVNESEVEDIKNEFNKCYLNVKNDNDRISRENLRKCLNDTVVLKEDGNSDRYLFGGGGNLRLMKYHDKNKVYKVKPDGKIMTDELACLPPTDTN